jgi:hypothetical protein
MTLQELFTDIATLRNYVPSLAANVDFKSLSASSKLAFKQISQIIPLNIIESIKQEQELLEDLRIAIANCILYRQSPFDVIQQRKEDVDIYKNEREAMERAYRENYYSALDSLVKKLDESDITAWKNSSYYLLLKELPIKSTAEMNSLYPIDNSHLFFFRTITFQQEVTDTLFNLLEQTLESDILTRRIKRAIAKKTIALSMRQFDPLEMPATLRNLFSDSNASRSHKNEQERLLSVSRELENEANESLRSIDQLLHSNEDEDISTQTSFNEPDDKIFFMP